MKRSKYFIEPLWIAALMVLCGAAGTHGAITLQLTDATARARTGFTSAGTAGASIASNELIGLYKFNSTGSGAPENPFWSVCLSPEGSLNWQPHIYTALSFDPGMTGNNPATWSTVGTGDSGIQNAQYLWRLFSPTIIAGGNSFEGAGLALAIYEVLYDSTGYGAYNATDNGAFYVTSGLSGAVETAYNSYLSVFNNGASSAANVSANLASGFVLRSTETGAGQDLIWNLTPVPEPTTIIAGAMLLLPFGFSTLRVLRRNRKA